MNTLSINAPSRSLVWRFAWKEYRMLRGFWIASAIIGLLVQLMISATVQHRPDLASAVFMVAWGGAAFYSVGAAIMMFAAETEDRTRDYLRLLGGDWRCIFATKVLLALVTAFLLGGVLTVTGGWLAGSLPAQQDAAGILKVAGIAVLEFLAWGLLFSLWWKHPLLAAVAAIAAASLGAQWAILATTDSQNSWTADAYAAAVPGRLAICLMVFAADVWLGRRWLYPEPSAKLASGVVVAKPASGRRKMFTRLLWQTWRESWRAILVAMPLSVALVAMALIPAYLRDVHDFLRALPFVALVPPALLGALVFRADWQKDHRLFLATHAVRPRCVWLARQVVWLGTMLLVGIVLHVLASWAMSAEINDHVARYLEDDRWYNPVWLGRTYTSRDSGWIQAWRFDHLQQTFLWGALVAWCAFISAYAVGQLCSMLLRQTLLSGFLAILLAIIIATWSVLMFLWEMNPLWFILPIGVGALLATWLRMPSWILQRNHLKHWIVPTIIVAVPLVAIIAAVPSTRMAQIDNLRVPDYRFLQTPIVPAHNEFMAARDEQRELWDAVRRIGWEMDTPTFEELIVDGKTWFDYGLDSHTVDAWRSGERTSLEPAQREILGKFAEERSRELARRNQHAVSELLKLTKNPDFSRLLFNSRQDVDLPYNNAITWLLAQDARRLEEEDRLEEAWQRLAALAAFNWASTPQEQRFTERLLEWAQHPQQTTALLKQAAHELREIFARLPHPREQLVEDYQRVRETVLGNYAPPSGPQWTVSLNSLPGERRRALKALELLANQALNYVDAVVFVAQPNSGISLERQGRRLTNPRQLLWPAPESKVFAINEYVFPDHHNFELANVLAHTCATSLLVAQELNATRRFDSLVESWARTETRRRSALVQLGLMAYRHEHGEYPESLAELVPDYLPEQVVDPFSGRAFEYRARGLEYRLLIDEDQMLPPHTPFLWSVGYTNMQLTEPELIASLVMRRDDPRHFSDELLRATEAGEFYQRFRGTGFESISVFPLPQVEAEEETEK